MTPPIVSVIVPLFTPDASLDVTLDNILGQTIADMEVLCVAADDAAVACAERYARRDARVKILQSADSGAGAMKNLAIRSASGAYVGFVEPGDGIAPGMYEALVRFADTHRSADIVLGDYEALSVIDGARFVMHHQRLVGARATDYGILLNPRKHAYLFGVDPFQGAGIYRRSFLTRYAIRYRETEDATFSEHGFWFQTFALAQGVAFLPQSFCQHREADPVCSLTVQEMRSLRDEYDFIEQRLRCYRGVLEAVRIPYLRKRYEACAWALRRVDAAAWPPLVQRMQEDLAQRIPEARDIDRMFSPIVCRRLNKELRLLLEDAASYRAYLAKQIQDVAKRQKKLTAWAARKPTAIVGTGAPGVAAQILLARRGIRAAAFVGNDDAEGAAMVNGVPVKSLAQLDTPCGMQFLIAVEKQGKEIKEHLQAAGVDARDIKSFELRRLSLKI